MTITHDDIYKRFLIEYDKANITSSYPSLTKHEAVAILNKAYKALISQKVTGNNPRRASFETDLKSIEDLRPLVKTSNAISITGPVDGISNQYEATLPSEMMYYLLSYLKDIHNQIHNTDLVSHQLSLAFKQTATNTPWIENPVVYMEGDDIRMLVDPSDDQYEAIYVTYIKTPELFEVEEVVTEDQGQGGGNTPNPDPNVDPNVDPNNNQDTPQIRIQVGNTPTYLNFSTYGITQQILEAACDGQYEIIFVLNNQETVLLIKRYNDLTISESETIQDYLEYLDENGIDYLEDGNWPLTCYYGIHQGLVIAMFSIETSRITN